MRTIQHGTLTFTARLKSRCEAQRDNHMAALFVRDGDFPDVALVGGMLLVVFRRDEGGYSYGIAKPELGFNAREYDMVYGPYETRQAAAFAGRRNLAQRTFSLLASNGLSCIHPDDADGRKEHEAWIRFQVGYAELRKLGFTEVEAHEVALSGPRSAERLKDAEIRMGAKLVTTPGGARGWKLGELEGREFIVYTGNVETMEGARQALEVAAARLAGAALRASEAPPAR